MSVSYSRTSSKCCAKCECWTGERELTSSRTAVEVEAGSVKGNCIEQKREKYASDSCSKFQQWALLK